MWLYVLPSIPVAESEYCSTLTCSSNQLECFGFEGDELARWTFKKTYLFVRVPFPCIYSFPILGVFATSLVFTVKVSSAPELQIGMSAVRSPLNEMTRHMTVTEMSHPPTHRSLQDRSGWRNSWRGWNERLTFWKRTRAIQKLPF